MLRPKPKPAEPNYAQQRHLETIERCAADLTAAVERAIGATKTREVGVAAGDCSGCSGGSDRFDGWIRIASA